MSKSQYLTKSLISAFGVLVYVSLVSWLMFSAETIFGKNETFIIPIFMLLLFIISASITGLLVLGKPVMMYFNNQKKEAIILFFSTLVWLVVFLLIVGIILSFK